MDGAMTVAEPPAETPAEPPALPPASCANAKVGSVIKTETMDRENKRRIRQTLRGDANQATEAGKRKNL